ncbi:argininosuccinate lyase [Acanthopleuribacter pedis]|uniref:Argininosuccinate lyase n=1 Tax=Acanthopleuribacter pedis TaxID=442870 RepID=A0A8J7U518_9BACT|nr:argininosuccinate lyase [Acanthopleuribacter pedis]MBO1320038.1 argininosuccinate lyase [Acanthopleuribacter pedis]
MKLYKGRIPNDPNPLMDEINRSLPFDIRLLPYDVATNRAWAGELQRLGVFSAEEYAAVQETLTAVQAEFEAGGFDPLPDDEDVHTLVERKLTEALGPVGARIHTGRSRNDQVVTDLRLYCVERLKELGTALLALIQTLATRAREHRDTLMAGTTHMQPALPVTLGHYLLSLAAAIQRDHDRTRSTLDHTNRCPLGAGAMAGSGFPVDRQALADALGFAGVLPNSIDAVSDRDFCIEIASTCALITTHLSRYADQFIVWANPAFGTVRFADQWSTGSSMMPQKRNPDAMELIRGKASRVHGNLVHLLSMLKGVPLSYAKDLQEDKEPLFEALDTTLLCVRVFDKAVASATFNPERLAAALTDDMLATDLADALARAGVPFRVAHERVGAWVSELEAAQRGILETSLAERAQVFPELGENGAVLSFADSVAARHVAGGTAPSSVDQQIADLEQFLQTNGFSNEAGDPPQS